MNIERLIIILNKLGCSNIIYLSLSNDIKNITGEYFFDFKTHPILVSPENLIELSNKSISMD
jgi:hypothetical protein